MSKTPMFEQLEARQLLAGNVVATLVNGLLTIRDTSAGGNQITVAHSNVSGATAIFNNDVALNGLTTVNGADAQGIAGNPAVVLPGVVTGIRVILARAGGDTLVVTSGVDIAAGVVTQTADATGLETSFVLGTRGLVVEGGAGADTVGLFGLKVAGNVNIDLERGANQLAISAGYATVGITGFNAVAGTDPNAFIPAAANVADLNAASPEPESFASVGGALSVESVGGNTQVSLIGVHVGGGTIVRMGNNTVAPANALNLDSFTTFGAGVNQVNVLTGPLTVVGGAGSDVVNFLNSAAVVNATHVGRSVRMVLGGGADAVNAGIDQAGVGVAAGAAIAAATVTDSTLTVTGNMDIDSAGLAGKLVDLRGIGVTGNLDIKTGSGADAVSVREAVANGSTIGGNLVINAGLGANFVTVAGVAGGVTTVGGSMNVVETGAGSFFGGDGAAIPTAALNERVANVAVAKNVNILMGAGANIYTDGANVAAGGVGVARAGAGSTVHENGTALPAGFKLLPLVNWTVDLPG